MTSNCGQYSEDGSGADCQHCLEKGLEKQWGCSWAFDCSNSSVSSFCYDETEDDASDCTKRISQADYARDPSLGDFCTGNGRDDELINIIIGLIQVFFFCLLASYFYKRWAARNMRVMHANDFAFSSDADTIRTPAYPYNSSQIAQATAVVATPAPIYVSVIGNSHNSIHPHNDDIYPPSSESSHPVVVTSGPFNEAEMTSRQSNRERNGDDDEESPPQPPIATAMAAGY